MLVELLIFHLLLFFMLMAEEILVEAEVGVQQEEH
jgi:hypothetical protein